MTIAPPLLLGVETPPSARLPRFGPQAKAAFFALGAVLLWATWPILATMTNPAPPFLVFGLAAGMGFLVSLCLSAAQGELASFMSISPRTLATVAIGLLSNNILYLLAMPRIGPAEANVIAYLWPVLLVLLMARIGRERLGVGRTVGITIAFGGASLAIGPAFEHGFDPLGILLAFLSGLAFAIYAAIRSFGRETRDVVGPSMGLIAVLALSIHVMFEPPASLTLDQWLAIGGIGIAPLTLSNALWDRAVRAGHTATVSAIAYFTPLVSILLLTTFGVTMVSASTGAGAILIVTGALAASGLFSRRKPE